MKYKCCICGKEVEGYGNNPYPLCDPEDYDSKCCDECNSYVLEARMMQMQGLDLTPTVIEDIKERAVNREE